MKLLVHGLLAGVWLAAGLMFAGCASTSQSQIQPPAPLPPSVARFRVGDTVTVSYSGIPNPMADYTEVIKEDGNITPTYLGPIQAVGKTAGELQHEIYTNYVPSLFIRLTVTVKSGDRVYYVGGEVGRPGIFQYVSDTTVTKAIQSAGGLTDFANHSKVWITHSSTGTRLQVDYDQALSDSTKDPPVYPNDQINVEKRIF